MFSVCNLLSRKFLILPSTEIKENRRGAAGEREEGRDGVGREGGVGE